MKRRTFLQSVIAACIAPSLPILKSKDVLEYIGYSVPIHKGNSVATMYTAGSPLYNARIALGKWLAEWLAECLDEDMITALSGLRNA